MGGPSGEVASTSSIQWRMPFYATAMCECAWRPNKSDNELGDLVTRIFSASKANELKNVSSCEKECRTLADEHKDNLKCAHLDVDKVSAAATEKTKEWINQECSNPNTAEDTELCNEKVDIHPDILEEMVKDATKKTEEYCLKTGSC